MANREIQATWDYHNGTKLPNRTLFDWSQSYDSTMRPLLFKVYTDLTATPLPLDTAPRGVPALHAIAVNNLAAGTSQAVDLGTLTRLFYFSAGITKYLTRPPSIRVPFRAAACTGALYHIELYLICDNLPGLVAGVYNLDPQGPSIRQLRQGDFRQVLVEASGYEPSATRAPAILVATDVICRNAIKYQTRAYRHSFWDSGTILANMLAITATHRLSVKVVAGFVDAMVSRLLDLDPRRELALALVPIGVTPNPSRPPAPPLSALNPAVQPVSSYEIDYPAIHTMHAASSLVVSIWQPMPSTSARRG